MGSIRDDAARVLHANWVEPWGFTVPSRRLYGHQWNWDSAMHVLGWAVLDPPRAWRELRALLSGQHADGLVGHVTYRPEERGYFPGVEWWQVHPSAPAQRIASRITQPPLAAICLELAEPRLAAAIDGFDPRPDLRALDAWHALLCGPRAPGGEPVVVHPWETGRDNAAEWDEALAGTPSFDGAMARHDLDSVRRSQRPTSAEYRRFVGLLGRLRALGFDQGRMASQSPFQVHDPLFSLVTLRACRALCRLAERWGEEAIAERQRRLADALSPRMRRAARCSVARAAEVWREDPDDLGDLAALVTEGPLSSAWGVRSLAAGDPGFEARRYWRGPVWPHLTWWIAEGFRSQGRADVHDLLRERTRAALSAVGMREYVHPDAPEGLGAVDQAWTAAVAVWWDL